MPWRAGRYKATEFDLAIKVYEKAFGVMGDVKPPPSKQNKATLHYNCARAAANVGKQSSALKFCQAALDQVPAYASALEQRAKCHLALYNYKLAADDCDTLLAGATGADAAGNLDRWASIKREARAKLDQSHFDVLGLASNATAAELKKGYRQACVAWHPDKHVTTDDAKHRAHIMFQKVNEAHEVLSDPTKRRNYEYTQRFSSPGRSPGGFGAGTGGVYGRGKSPSAKSASPGTTGRWPYSTSFGYDSEDDEDGNL